MRKPIIGITPAHNTDNDDLTQRPTYFHAIAAAGGLPLLLPLEGSTDDFSQLASLCDGFLFSGGESILVSGNFIKRRHSNAGNHSQ